VRGVCLGPARAAIAIVLSLLITGVSADQAAPGERRLRIDVDITGDGDPEVLLSWSSDYGKSGQDWEVWSPTATGRLVQVPGRLAFNPAMGFSVDAARAEILVVEPISVGLARLVTYRISSTGVTRLATRDVEDRGTPNDHGGAEMVAALAATESFWARSRPVQLYAVPGEVDGEEPIWRDRAGRPVPGLRRLTRAGRTTAPPIRLNLGEHLLEARPCGPISSCEIWVVELEPAAGGIDEVLATTSVHARGRGWVLYRRDGAAYRAIGRVPFEPLGFRYDAPARQVVVANDHDRRVEVYEIGAGAVRLLRTTDWQSDFLGIARPELDRGHAWRAGQASRILRRPLEGFRVAPATGWSSLIDQRPASPRTTFAALVVNPLQQYLER